MATLQVVTFAVFALSIAGPARAESQSRFAQPRTQAEQMRFRAMDRNNDGVVTRQEWRGSDQSFGVHDWNGDGILSGDEVRESFWTTGEDASPEADPAASERQDRFEYLDTNNNGRVERSEWHASDDAWQWLDRNNDNVLSRAEVVGNQRRAVNRRESNTAVPARPVQDCTSSAPQVVDDIYQQVLERPADQASAALTQALVSGRMTVRDIVAQVAKSPEHAERFFWQPIVSAVYRQVMQREPSQEELRVGAADLARGERRLTEFVARIATRAANNNENAVRILYQRLLGRDPDPSGLQVYTEMANRDGIEAVARSIVNSAEYRQAASSGRAPNADFATYEKAVRSLYRHVLGRDPDPIGLQDLTRTAVERDFGLVVDRMVQSPEYDRLFGDNVVPGRNVRYCGTTR
jgi:Ca2+-binding EF-hand superfamily protein